MMEKDNEAIVAYKQGLKYFPKDKDFNDIIGFLENKLIQTTITEYILDT